MKRLQPVIWTKGTFLSPRSEEHTSELQSLRHLVCRLLLEKIAGETVSIFRAAVHLHACRQPDCYVLHGQVARIRVRCLGGVSNFFFNDTATTEIYTLSLHDALPIYVDCVRSACGLPAGSALGCIR